MSMQDNFEWHMNSTYAAGENPLGGCFGGAFGCGMALVGLAMVLTAVLLVFAGPVGWLVLVVLVVLVRWVLIPLVGYIASLKGRGRGR